MTMLVASLLLGFWFLTAPCTEAWNLHPKQKWSRRALLENSALVSASLLTNANSVAFAEDAANGSDMLHKTSKVGVLWHAARQQALPAVPKTLERIAHTEWLADDRNNNDTSSTSGMVFIGERHDDFEHHMVQTRCIKTLRKALASTSTRSKEELSIGVEWFQRQHQPYLDRFISDPSFSFSHLKQATNWDKTWGYDMLHYVPILSYAKTNGIRLYGLHPSDQQVQEVTQIGADALPNSLKDGVLARDPEHYKLFQQIMNLPEGALNDPATKVHMDRLYLVQCFREEYMAESVALYQLIGKGKAKKRPDEGHWTVVLAGDTHVAGRGGLPSRALRRLAEESGSGKPSHLKRELPKNRGVYTILPRTIEFPLVALQAPNRLAADYVWFVENESLKKDQVNPSPLRGVQA